MEIAEGNFRVYSGPSGKFKAHVNAPRSPNQFSSLIICLPLDHQGGALKVRHKDNDNKKNDFVHWATFYSNCKHKVLETIHDMINEKKLWPNSGLISYNYSQVYSHKTKTPINFTAPDNLKGADMVMFEIFSSMGLHVRFQPAIHNLKYTKYS
ncbi:hypothetical protein B0T25DRAFT_572463 [Lasiosphaeria hispida]|uniref:Uncharacterized protein n=1 Tax=Lasiosphaeria hispida TaxID=260671 RepID=A0AAJ0H8H2_9PEZI|nr:hypothetical protein B0T25DRAFT_572463 [Lasiosphaeria hispida]